MRLLKLAVELKVSQRDIFQYLSEKGYSMPENENTRLTEEQVGLIKDHFLELRITSDNEEEAADDSPAAVQNLPVSGEPTVSMEKPSSADPVEVIRARKIKLEGIKVIGKIELPEPVNKENEKKKVPSAITTDSSKKRKNSKKGRFTAKRTETYQHKLRRQEKAIERQKVEQQKQLKEKRKQHYEQRMAGIASSRRTSNTKVKTKKVKTTFTPARKPIGHHPNPLVRVWHWLNGRYDT